MGTTEVLVDGKPMTVTAGRLCVFVMQQGIRFDVPDAVEIGLQQTLKTMKEMSQRAWVHIARGGDACLFPHLFKMATDGKIPIPKTIDQLNAGDMGVTHLCGMIVMMCEALFEGKQKIFLRNPETLLHPSVERNMMLMIQELMRLLTGYDPKIG